MLKQDQIFNIFTNIQKYTVLLKIYFKLFICRFLITLLSKSYKKL